MSLRRSSAWRAGRCSARSSFISDAPPAPSHQGAHSRRNQTVGGSRHRRAHHWTAADHPVFRSHQDRQPVRPHRPLYRAEIDTILAGVWDNLGRLGAEFAHIDHIWEHDPARPEDSRIEIQPRTHELFAQLRLDRKPALIFASHLGNWELPALAAVAHGLDAATLYRRPNIASANRIIEEMRAVKMGTLIPASHDAPLKLAQALQNGQHVAMLVDQYFTNGVEVTFFGRKTKANPMLARLLRQIECPIHGVRIIRLPGHRFRAELSEEVAPVRDAAGQIDVQATMQAITSVIEGWIREYPDQWLWLHRRWR
jgi:KDO2-lipid IV(A) lauroyltransferase